MICTSGIFPEAIGGIQRHSHLLVKSLAKLPNIDLVVVHPHGEKRLFSGYPHVKEIGLQAPKARFHYLEGRYKYSRRVYEVCQSYPQHLVLSQGISVWYKAGKLKDRLIYHPHGLEPFQTLNKKEKLKYAPYRFILKSLFRKSKKVISLGGKLTSIIRRQIKDAEKIQIFPNAVVMPQEEVMKSFEAEKLNVLFVGRFAENKGIDTLLEAIEILDREGEMDRFGFCLAGKGPLYAKTVAAGMHENVRMPGFVSDEDLFNAYKSDHLFVLPTRFEGMPTVILEAMAHGMAVITTDVGATKDLVSDANGYIVPTNDAQHLAKTILEYAYQNKQSKQKMALNSIHRANNLFSWPKVAGAMDKWFESLYREKEGILKEVPQKNEQNPIQMNA